MSKKEFEKLLEETKKKNDVNMRNIRELSDKFSEKVKEIIKYA